MDTFSDRTSRRHAIKHLLRGAAQGVQEIATPLGLGGKPAERTLERPPAQQPPIVPGEPTRTDVTREQLSDWAAELGLKRHRDGVMRLCLTSLRLTKPGQGEGGTGRSRIGGKLTLDNSDEWPSWEGRALRFLAEIDLTAIDSRGLADLPLSRPGLLQIFHARQAPSGLAPEHSGACRVIWRPAEHQAPVTRRAREGGTPLRLTKELMLPRRWFAGVQDLKLGEPELEAWDALRLKLARAQGVNPHDTVGGRLVLHRLFGYADERRGDMRLASELLERGYSLNADRPRSHPSAYKANDRVNRWRLLAQLSKGEDQGLAWPGDADRLYIWVNRLSLQAGDFSRVRAFLR